MMNDDFFHVFFLLSIFVLLQIFCVTFDKKNYRFFFGCLLCRVELQINVKKKETK